jgi:hypothetical protein
MVSSSTHQEQWSVARHRQGKGEQTIARMLLLFGRQKGMALWRHFRMTGSSFRGSS